MLAESAELAAVYTQTTDVEVEVNGVMTYDREVIKLDVKDTASWHKSLSGPPPEYRELVPHERLVYTDKFEDPNPPGEIVVTVLLKKVMGGTDLNIVQENIPSMFPVEMCYLGWQESLEQLAKLVEPEIPDGP